jgi:hypothetical protein
MPVISNARWARHRRLGYLIGSGMLVAGIAAGSIAAGGTAQAAVRVPLACPVTNNAATALFANGQPAGGTQLRASAGCPNLDLTYVDATATYRGWLRAAAGGRWVPCRDSFFLRKGSVRVRLCTGIVAGALIKVVGPPSTHVRYNAGQGALGTGSACHFTEGALTSSPGNVGTVVRVQPGGPNPTVTYVAATATYRGWLRAASGGAWLPCHFSYHLNAGNVSQALCTGVVPGALMRVTSSLPISVRYNIVH